MQKVVSTSLSNESIDFLKTEALMKDESLSSHVRGILEDTVIKRLVLVDYENVHSLFFDFEPNDKVVVFLGNAQNQIPIDDVAKMQVLGKRGEYIYTNPCGRPNALDFCLVYYLGKMRILNPTWEYVIVSNDAGYDVVIEELKKEGAKASRLEKVQGLQDYIRITVRELRSILRPPKTLNKLENFINSGFQDLSIKTRQAILKYLLENNLVILSGENVVYNLSP